MKTKYLAITVPLLFVGFILYNIFTESDTITGQRYRTGIMEDREAKDRLFRGSASPLPEDDRKGFKGLTYFDIDPQFRVKAVYEKINDPEEVRMPTSDGKIKIYLRYAKANFNWEGRSYSLLLLKSNEPLQRTLGNQLFLAFTDETSGRETYGAGRYMELEEVANGEEIIIDFNLAYNPYCAYSNDYSCPLPLRENRLRFKVLAGEKDFEVQ